MKLILYISLLFVASGVFGQSLSSKLSKESIQIGEPFELTLRVEYSDSLHNIVYMPPQDEMVGYIIPDTVEATVPKPYTLEIYEAFKDTLLFEKDKFVWEAKFTLTGWDSAAVMLAQERIVVDDSTFIFPAQFIEIISPIASAKRAFYDIEESQLELDPALSPMMRFVKTHWWWLLIIILGVAFLTIYIFRKKKKKYAIIGEAPETLKDRVIEEIDKLEASKLYDTDLKEYYFQLSIILRKFFSKNFNEPFMDKTTAQIRSVLRTKKLAPDTIQTIITLLQSSDLVKFAKSVPTEEEVKAVTHKARQVVAEVARIQIIVPTT